MRAFSVDEVGNYLADGYWDATGSWHPPLLNGTITVNLLTLSAANQNLVRLALQAWTDLGFKFSFTGSGSADILFVDDYSGGYTNWTDRSGRALVNVGPDFTAAYGSAFGGYTYQSWVHEIGHALGLGHTGAYNGTGTYGVDNHFTNDSWQMSVMSYFPQDENTSISASFAYVMTPMPGDIAAIEKLYDLSANPGQGNTVYFWGTNASGIHGVIGRQLQSGRLQVPVAMTIVDYSGIDTLNFSGFNQSVRIDLRPGSINDALGLKGNILIERDTVIEHVDGSRTNDVISGQGAGNILDGGRGHDRLDGRNGNDTLLGGSGNDTIFGGNGNDVLRGHSGADILNGGAGRDKVLYDSAAVVVDLSTRVPNAGDARGDILRSIEDISGSRASDRIFGDSSSNQLLGHNGNDLLDGRVGNDRLEGGTGNDTLLGSAGNDGLFGGDGNDRLVGGAGADTLHGGSGRDIVIYDDAAVRVGLSRTYPNAGDARGDILLSVEDISGSRGNDTLVGDKYGNRFSGNNGNDILDGRHGNDRLEGGAGSDTLIGGVGNDTVFGGTGNDRILGQSGHDTLAGGIGADEFEFRGGHHYVMDFRDDKDELLLDVSRLGLSGSSLGDILDMATVIDGDTHIDLGNGNYIVLNDIGNVNELANDIVLI